MQKLSIKEAYKMDLIALAKNHKEHCNGEDCNISLILLAEMGKKLGIKFTKKELKTFL